jgi:hypothetical protein
MKVTDLHQVDRFVDVNQLIGDLDVGGFKVYGIPLGDVHVYIDFAKQHPETFEDYVRKIQLLSGASLGEPENIVAEDDAEIQQFIDTEISGVLDAAGFEKEDTTSNE